MLLYAPLCTVIQEILERLFTELAETTVLRRPFQIFTTRWLKKTWCGITTAPLDCRLELVSTSIPCNFVLWNFHPLEWHNAKPCLSHMSLETVKQHQYFMLTTQCFPFQLIVDTINCLRGLTRSIYRSPSTHCLVALRQNCSVLGSMYCLEKRSCQLHAVWYMVLVGHALGMSGI